MSFVSVCVWEWAYSTLRVEVEEIEKCFVTLALNNILQDKSDHLFWVSSAHLCMKKDFFWRVFIIYRCSDVAEFIWEMPMRYVFKSWIINYENECSGASLVIRMSINDHKFPLLWSSLLILPMSHTFSLFREKYHKELNLMPNPNLAVVHLLYQAVGSHWTF